MNDALVRVRHLWEHVFWADAKLLQALRLDARRSPEAAREFAHVIGTEEVWLSRLERRSARCAVWPDLPFSEIEQLLETTHAAYDAYLAALQKNGLEEPVDYVNSAGREFTNTVEEILVHAALHGQYHRGKVNLLLRQAGMNPAPVDYIAFVRGAPAARSK